MAVLGEREGVIIFLMVNIASVPGFETTNVTWLFNITQEYPLLVQFDEVRVKSAPKVMIIEKILEDTVPEVKLAISRSVKVDSS